MTRAEFLRLIEQKLDLDPGAMQEHYALEEVSGWDSLSVVTFMALADEQFGLELDPKQLEPSTRVGDLLDLFNDKLLAP